MRASRWRRRASLILVAATAACAKNPAPIGWLSPAVAAQNDPYGAWIVVTTSDTSGTSGEFLAVDNDSVFVLSLDSTVRAVPRASVREARIAFYQAQLGTVILWSALGTLSTLSNGVLLVFTAPTWIIGGTVASASESRAPLRTVARPEDWEGVRGYARFPMGMPPNLPRRLPTKPLR
jgi:hypothetical protein